MIQTYSIARPKFVCFKTTKLAIWPEISYSHLFRQFMQLLLPQHNLNYLTQVVELNFAWRTQPLSSSFSFSFSSSFHLTFYSQTTSGKMWKTYLSFQLQASYSSSASPSSSSFSLWILQFLSHSNLTFDQVSIAKCEIFQIYLSQVSVLGASSFIKIENFVTSSWVIQFGLRRCLNRHLSI